MFVLNSLTVKASVKHQVCNNIPQVPTRQKPVPDDPIKKWIAENYGAISCVAREHGVTPQHAHYIAHGKRTSRDLRIERALKALGCPLRQKIN
jgi:hypothetical protein